MDQPFITVKSGGPEIPEGVYPVFLKSISDVRTVTAQRGPKAGQDIDLLDWIFTIDTPGQPYDGLDIDVSTSTASGPKSKMYAFLTALFNGVAPATGTQFTKQQLVGRGALATVKRDEDGGWLRITNLSAIPIGMQQQRFAQATGSPVVQPPAVNPVPAASTIPQQPILQPVGAAAAQTDDLPF